MITNINFRHLTLAKFSNFQIGLKFVKKYLPYFTKIFRYFTELCQYKVTLQSIVLVMPVWAVLLITVVRTVFVIRPLDHVFYLKIKYQILGMVFIVALCVLLFILPHLGLCEVILDKVSGYQYCRYKTGTVNCTIFSGLLVFIGYVLPILIVLTLYIVIYKLIIKSRRISSKLTNSGAARAVYYSSSDKQIDRSKSTKSWCSDREGQERNSIPWCIIVILLIFMVSSLPWIPMEIMTRDLVNLVASGSYFVLLVDIMYSVLFFSVAVSPLMYLLTSNTLRNLVKSEIRGFANMC